MIGAMPAVAVRHERRKQEKRHKRPSQLVLQSPMSHASSSPSPVQSPPLTRTAAAAAAAITGGADAPDELYIFGKVMPPDEVLPCLQCVMHEASSYF